MNKKKVCVIATVPFVIRWFMAPHVLALSEKYSVTLVANGEPGELGSLLSDNITYHPVKMQRKISLIGDIVSLYRIVIFFHQQKFDYVHSIMPKSGLLAMIAAKITKVPFRYHTFTGQVWVNKKGIFRLILKTMDKLISLFSTRTLADSRSQMNYLIENNIVSASKINVLGNGSVSGVDLTRFKPNQDIRKLVRRKYGISPDGLVFLFVGRLNYDKGIRELIDAYSRFIYSNNIESHLMLVGPDEENISNYISNYSKELFNQIHKIGFTQYPEDYMAAADVFCLPSHREGFGSVIIEAAACGIPAVASRIYGIIDAVVDKETGLLVSPGNVQELTDALNLLARNEELRLRLGKAAFERVKAKFNQEILVHELLCMYKETAK